MYCAVIRHFHKSLLKIVLISESNMQRKLQVARGNINLTGIDVTLSVFVKSKRLLAVVLECPCFFSDNFDVNIYIYIFKYFVNIFFKI